jgi:hypothetical protein
MHVACYYLTVIQELRPTEASSEYTSEAKRLPLCALLRGVLGA